MSYLSKLSIALGQLINALFNGSPGETLSAACYRCRNYSVWRRLMYKAINSIYFWQLNHCRLVYESNHMRGHLSGGL